MAGEVLIWPRETVLLQSIRIRLTKKLIQNEPHGSHQQVEPDARHLREAVVTAQKISRFYRDYQTAVEGRQEQSNVMPRDATQLLAQMRNQTLFVCERMDDDPDKVEVVAGSVLWKHEMPVASQKPEAIRGFETETFLELGTQVVTLNGFRLQWVLTAVTILERLAYDPTGILVAATYRENERAANNFLKVMRFKEWNEVPATWYSLRIHHLREAGQESRGVRWFRPTADTLIAAADLLLDLHNRPERTVSPRAIDADIKRIAFSFDTNAFQRTAFDKLRAMAEKLSEVRPGTLQQLRALLDNETVSENLFDWSTS